MTDNWNILGQEWAVEMLKQHLARDSVRHAYLFTGPPGLGRRTLALRFAQALNCPNPVAPGEPCGKCRTCQQIERMQYADLSVIQAEKEGGTLKVEQIRATRQSLVLKPYQGKYRVALFLRFQEANANAANALLKTLEEAPAQVVLLVTADTAEQLLPTIVSRCEVLRLRPLPVELVEEYLKERGADEASAHLLAHVSGGRPGYSLSLMENKDALDFRRMRLDDLQKLLKSNRRERFAYAGKLTDRKTEAKERFRETLFIWLSFWRDVLLRAAGPAQPAPALHRTQDGVPQAQASVGEGPALNVGEASGAPLANVDCLGEIESLAGRLSLAEARKLVRGVESAVEKLERNVNARLLAEVLLLDWPHV